MIPHLPIPARFRIYLRFVRYLLWEFRWPLGVFATVVLAGGTTLWLYYRHEPLNFARACHVVFLMIFLESSIDFPDEWYLQPLFFLFPIVGLGAVADSVIRLAFLMFSRKQNQPEWNRMLASLCRNHMVVVGVDRVGYQVIKELLELRETIVAIELASEALLLSELFDRGIPVIQGNARLSTVLEQAGVAAAKAVIVTTGDDLTNLDIALDRQGAQSRWPGSCFGCSTRRWPRGSSGPSRCPSISTSQVAAPAFIAAATGRKVYQGFQLAGQSVHLTDLIVCPSGRLVGKSVGELQADKRVNIVMYQGSSGVNVNPDQDIVLTAGDTILVIAPMEPLLKLEGMNRPLEGAGNSVQTVSSPLSGRDDRAPASRPST